MHLRINKASILLHSLLFMLIPFQSVTLHTVNHYGFVCSKLRHSFMEIVDLEGRAQVTCNPSTSTTPSKWEQISQLHSAVARPTHNRMASKPI